MKAFLISDNEETALGIKLAGVDGVVLHNKDEIAMMLDKLISEKEIGIVIFTQSAAALVADKIRHIRLNCRFPLIIEIPDRNGQDEAKVSILEQLKESMGVKIRGDDCE